MDRGPYDVVVLGTGAAGLVAAISARESGASVGLFDKFEAVGGTTAMSGGVIWLPNNSVAARLGVADSREESLRYLKSLSNGSMKDELVEVLVDTVPVLTDWLEAKTPLRFQLCMIPDYHPEHPGGKPHGGRSLEPKLFPFDQLGTWADKVVLAQYSDPITGDGYLMTTDTPRGGGTGRVEEEDMEERRRHRMNGRGRGIVGALLKACLDRGVEPVLGARALELMCEQGRVVGVRIEKNGAEVEVRAKAVIVATGGFEWNREMVSSYLRGPMTHPASLPSNSGDGQKMMMRVGAALGMMQEAWWVPALAVPGETQNYGAPKVFLMLGERAHPGSILVNRSGRRFCNEATNYNAISGAFHVLDPVKFEFANLPCWLVFDQNFVRQYGFFVLGVAPGGEIPAWITRSETPTGLAATLGIDAPGLLATLERWNQQVTSGTDPDFGRGDSAYDGWNGDLTHYPDRRSTLGPITSPPYYAVEIHSGALGTKGGAQTDRHGAVLDHSGQPIPGLYAAGNAMACVTGMAYGGAGGTIGPAMVFGYLAGRHAAHYPNHWQKHHLMEKEDVG